MASSFDWNFGISKSYENEDQRLIEGIATLETADSVNEIVEFESVKKSFGQYIKKNPILLLNHDDKKPIGQILEYKPIQKNGVNQLFVKGRVDHPSNPHSYVNEAWDLIKSGTYRSFSIRGTPDKRWYKKIKGLLTKFVSVKRLVETSVVSIGMNEDALFNVVSKSFGSQDPEGEEIISEDIIKSAMGSLKTDLLDEIDNRINKKFEGIEKTLSAIQKSLPEPPDEEKEELRKTIRTEFKKSFEDEKEMAELKKAFGIAPDPKKDEEDKDKDTDDLSKSSHVGLEEFAKIVKTS